jgi:hypothetical protein
LDRKVREGSSPSARTNLQSPSEGAPSHICDTITSWRIFDAIDGAKKSLIAVWIDKEKIGKREIGQLNQKIDMLEINGPGLPPQLLAGPIKSKRKPKMVSHIYKLRLNGDRALRPMLCKGPIEMEREFTMLIGAIEVGGVLDKDAEEAEIIRSAIIADKDLRKPHERYA